MESRRENNPDDIVVRVKPYPESYGINTEKFQRNITAEDFCDKELDVPVTSYIITIHKSMVEMAKAEDIEFTSEIDYDKFQAA